MAPSGETETTPATETTVSSWGERRKELMDKPPADDVCPICFGDFEVPCRASCGHWFCGSCILQYWNFSSVLQPCRCPVCLQSITKLVPEASLCLRHEVEISSVLLKVGDYNRLFEAGFGGFMLKLRTVVLSMMKKLLHWMLDPDRPLSTFAGMRTLSMVLWVLYSELPFDFARVDDGKIPTLATYSAVVLSVFFCGIGLYLRWKRQRNVRQLHGNLPAPPHG